VDSDTDDSGEEPGYLGYQALDQAPMSDHSDEEQEERVCNLFKHSLHDKTSGLYKKGSNFGEP